MHTIQAGRGPLQDMSKVQELTVRFLSPALGSLHLPCQVMQGRAVSGALLLVDQDQAQTAEGIQLASRKASHAHDEQDAETVGQPCCHEQQRSIARRQQQRRQQQQQRVQRPSKQQQRTDADFFLFFFFISYDAASSSTTATATFATAAAATTTTSATAPNATTASHPSTKRSPGCEQ